MKILFLISVLFAILILVPVASFAENPTSCTFSGKSTLLDNIFEKDFAVKAFTEKNPNVTRSLPTDESDSLKNQLILQAESDGIKERLEIRFHTDINGCYIPASYHYSYDDGTVDVTVRNSVANFTEIMNLIKSDDLSIKDFYPDDCTFVDLDVIMSNGKSYGICKEGISVTILVDATDDGSLQVDIPIEMVYSLPSSDCVPTGDFFVILDNEETHYTITPTETGNLVTVEFPEGFHKIRILGSVIIPDPSPAQYCGIVDGYVDKKYLAPLDQTDHGVSPKSIRCNEGLILVQKYDNTPACVTSVTKQHLMDRGWAKIQSIDEIKMNTESIRQNIIRIEDGFIALYPENMCASIDLDLPTKQDIQQYKNDDRGLDESNILQITANDLDEIPIVEELIYAVHSIEFPYNRYSSAYLDGMDFVEYEFFLMEKAMEKYRDSKNNYFVKLDNDYEERFTNPAKQGFTNHFEAPILVYNDAAYSVSGTNFWTSNEHEPRRMSVFPTDSIEYDEKFITLTDEDMKSIPKIKEAIESIGTVKESISAHKGLPENEWNEYREWFKQKSQERLNVDRFRLIEHNEHLYSIGFGIC